MGCSINVQVEAFLKTCPRHVFSWHSGRKSVPHWLLLHTRYQNFNSFTLSWKYLGSVQFHVKLTLGKIVHLSFLILHLVYAVWFLPGCITSFCSSPLLTKSHLTLIFSLMSSLNTIFYENIFWNFFPNIFKHWILNEHSKYVSVTFYIFS